MQIYYLLKLIKLTSCIATKKNSLTNLKIIYYNKVIFHTSNMKLLELKIDNMLPQKSHINTTVPQIKRRMFSN